MQLPRRQFLQLAAGAAALSQPFVVEDRPGAGNTATEARVPAQPDGHTLLPVGIANAINVTLYENPGLSFKQDIAPVAMSGPRPAGDGGAPVGSGQHRPRVHGAGRHRRGLPAEFGRLIAQDTERKMGQGGHGHWRQ